jgi:hypothetical protein
VICGKVVVRICELQCSRHNSSKGYVLCFCKSQQGVTFSCLVCSLREKYVLACVLASGRLIVWLRPCNALHTVLN